MKNALIALIFGFINLWASMNGEFNFWSKVNLFVAGMCFGAIPFDILLERTLKIAEDANDLNSDLIEKLNMRTWDCNRLYARDEWWRSRR